MYNQIKNKDASPKLFIKREYCKGCGICVEFCPSKILYMYDGKVHVKEKDNCKQCGLCELRCPDYAIYLKED